MSATPYVQRRIHEAALRLFAQQGLPQLSISELASAAGVARGTIYNHVGSTSHLFEQMVSELTDDMNQHIAARTAGCPDPALRLAHGMRLYIQRGHAEPDWGLFITTFAFNSTVMGDLWAGQPTHDLLAGIASNRFLIAEAQLPSTLALIGSAVIAGMHITREGLRTWREAGSDTAEHVLRALGIPAGEARVLAREPLPQHERITPASQG